MAKSTIDYMSDRELADLRDAGRGHLIDGAGPLLDKADELRRREREEPRILATLGTREDKPHEEAEAANRTAQDAMGLGR